MGLQGKCLITILVAVSWHSGQTLAQAVSPQFPPLQAPLEIVAELPSWWTNINLSLPVGIIAADLRREMSCPARRFLYDALELAIVNSVPEGRSNLVAAIVPVYIADVLTHGDTQRAVKFLKAREALLSPYLPLELAQWRFQMALGDGDGGQVQAAIREIISISPAYTNTPEYLSYQERLFKISTMRMQPLCPEGAPQSMPDTLLAFLMNGETNRLCVFLKEVLRLRFANTVEAEGDNALFLGAKSYYRSILGKYGAIYEEWLNREIETLKTKPSRKADAERFARTVRMTSFPSHDGVWAGGPSAAKPPETLAFIPLVDLSPGSVEVLENHLVMSSGTNQTPLPGAVFSVAQSLCWLSNSRMVTAIQDGQVKWSWAVPLQRLTGMYGSYGYGGLTYYLGKSRPAVAGNRVAVSALIQSATLRVVGLDKDTGAYQWCWRDDKGRVASDPVAWSTNRFVLMRVGGDPAQVEMVVLDAGSGKEVWSIPLCIRSHLKVDVGQGSIWKMSPPTMDGDVAYVSPGMGLVGAVNLADESLLWLRNYSRFERPDQKGRCLNAAPVTGRSVVLFAPSDSNHLLLVDKSTGRLLGERTDLDYIDMAACGPDHVLVVTPGSLHLLSLTDLKELKFWILPNRSILQPVREGCLITAADTSVQLIRPDGSAVRVMPASSGLQLLGCSPDGNWIAAGGPGYQLGGLVKGLVGKAPVVVRPVQNLRSMCDRSEGRLIPGMGSQILVQNNSIAMGVTAQGEVRWEFPIPGDDCGVIPLGEKVVTVHGGRLWNYNATDGLLNHVYPDGRTNSPRMLAVLRDHDGSGLVIGQDTGADLAMWKLDASGRVAGDPVARMDKGLAAGHFNDFHLLADARNWTVVQANESAGQQSAIWTVPRQPVPAALAPTKVGTASWVWVSRDRSQGAIAFPSGWLCTMDAAGLHESTVDFLGGKGYAPAKGTWVKEDLIEAQVDPEWSVYLNPVTGSLFRPRKLEIRPSAALGTQVYGVKLDGTNASPFSYDLQTGKRAVLCKPVVIPPIESPLTNTWAATAIPTKAGPTLILMPPHHYHINYVYVKVHGGDVAYPPLWSSLALVWNTPTNPVCYRIPSIIPQSMIWYAPGGLVNIRGNWMSSARWDSVLRLKDNVSSVVSTAGVAELDGFLAEWGSGEFRKVPNGEVALRVTGDGQMTVAMRVTNTNLVERLGTLGLDERLEIVVAPDSEIVFGEELLPFPKAPLIAGKTVRYHNGFWAPLSRSIRYAWSVHPAGKYLEIEAVINGLPVSAADSGNLLFGAKLLWYPSPMEPAVNLIGEEPTGPFAYAMFRRGSLRP